MDLRLPDEPHLMNVYNYEQRHAILQDHQHYLELEELNAILNQFLGRNPLQIKQIKRTKMKKHKFIND